MNTEEQIPQTLLDSPIGELIIIGQSLNDISLALYAAQQPKEQTFERLPVALTPEEVKFIAPRSYEFFASPIRTDTVLQYLAQSSISDAAYLLHITAILLDNCGQGTTAEKTRQLQEQLSAISDSL